MGKYVERFKQSGLGRYLAKFSADAATDGAILIGWQALLSLFPLILGFLALFGLFLRDAERRRDLVDAVQSQFPAQVTDLLGFMQETRDLSGWLAALSVGGLLWTGSNFFGAIARVLNRFYGAPDRSFIWQRLMAFTMMAIYLVLILFSIAATSVGHAAAKLSEWIFGFPLEGVAVTISLIIGWLLSLGSAFLMFLALFRVVPNTSVSFAESWRGALLSAVLFVALNQLFPLYLRFFGGGFEAYKTFGLFLLLMTWIYFTALIMCLGAELNAFLAGKGAQTAEEAVAIRAGLSPARGKGKRALAAAGANGQAGAPTAGKQILWAGLTAGVTALTMAAAQRTAAGVWRSMTGEEPPVPSD